jgi:hypothetical protein
MERRPHFRSRTIATFALISALGFWGAPTRAADPEKMPAPDAAQRQKMAEVHRKMAACLESTRPMAQCREEMHESCRGMMGEASCPMMGMGTGGMGPGMMHGPMHRGGTPEQPAPETPKK